MIEFIAFTAFIIMFFILAYKNIKLNIKLSSTSAKLVSTSIDNTILSIKLSDSLNTLDPKIDDTSTAFLKFVSDSRDWAYQYIDEVQEGLNKFITDIEPEIIYFDEYGVVGSAYPHYYSMKKISEAYKELKTLMPEHYDRID